MLRVSRGSSCSTTLLQTEHAGGISFSVCSPWIYVDAYWQRDEPSHRHVAGPANSSARGAENSSRQLMTIV